MMIIIIHWKLVNCFFYYFFLLQFFQFITSSVSYDDDLLYCEQCHFILSPFLTLQHAKLLFFSSWDVSWWQADTNANAIVHFSSRISAKRRAATSLSLSLSFSLSLSLSLSSIYLNANLWTQPTATEEVPMIQLIFIIWTIKFIRCFFFSSFFFKRGCENAKREAAKNNFIFQFIQYK